MNKVKGLIGAGSSIPSAIKESLPGTVRAFALAHGLNYTAVSDSINGNRAPTSAIVESLIAELGGTDQGWRELLHEAGRPVAKVG